MTNVTTIAASVDWSSSSSPVSSFFPLITTNPTSPISPATTTAPPTTMISVAEWRERVDTMAMFAFFGSCGIVLNLLPILLTVFTDMRRNKVHMMVANLSTADLLFSISFVFGQTQYVLYRDQLDLTACRWLAFFTFTTACFEFMFPPILSLNRYCALYYHHRYERIFTRRNIFLMALSCWLFCAIIPLIFTLCGKTGFDYDNQHCCVVVEGENIWWTVFYWLSIIVPLVCFCNGTMLFCNYKIYKKLNDHKSAQNLDNNVVKQNKELLYFLVADMIFPLLFHTTYHTAKFIASNRSDITIKRAFTCLYLINSCVRGLVTMTFLRPYRAAFRKAFCFPFLKNMSSVAPIASNIHIINQNRSRSDQHDNSRAEF